MNYLTFMYGIMNTGKTAKLLMKAYNFKSQQKKVILIKPEIDTRNGIQNITSRIGLSATADIILHKDNTPIIPPGKHFSILTDQFLSITQADLVLVDEAQFLSFKNVEMLRNLASDYKIPIICYGLLTDYRTKLFPGSQRLIELADNSVNITNCSLGNCYLCKNNKAIVNTKFRLIDKQLKLIKKGSHLPDIGAEEKYKVVCWKCWKNN